MNTCVSLTNSIVIPLEQGLRHNITIAVLVVNYSIVIPLEQGLRPLNLAVDISRHGEFYCHSIRTRIKTHNDRRQMTSQSFYCHSIRTRIKTMLN